MEGIIVVFIILGVFLGIGYMMGKISANMTDYNPTNDYIVVN